MYCFIILLMKDIGNIIYIVFVIIAVVFSVINKANKNKSSNRQPPGKGDSPRPGFPDFETLFEESDEPEEEPLEHPVFENSESPVKIEPEVVRNDFQERMRQIEIDKKRSFNKRKEESILRDVKKESESSFKFNAKEAIIYSEILKRPEF